MRRARPHLAATAMAAVLATCDGAPLTAPPNSTLQVTANPPTVAAHGGASVLTAFVIEPTGTAVSDGTSVRWFTDIGRIDPETRTRRGVAQANFVSDSRSGTAHVRAISGGVESGVIEITIGNVRVVAIRLRADPPRIIESNSTHVIATVFGEDGNPVPNVPIVFRINPDPTSPGTEFLDSSGIPQFTDNNGEARDVLRTRRNTVGVAEVQATAPNGVEASDPLRVPIL